MFPFFYILERISRQMPLEGKVNPRLKGALTRNEFILAYNSYLNTELLILGSKFFDVDKYYNHYLEAYKYDEDKYNKWLERKD